MTDDNPYERFLPAPSAAAPPSGDNPYARFVPASPPPAVVYAQPESSAFARVPYQIGTNLLQGAANTVIGYPSAAMRATGIWPGAPTEDDIYGWMGEHGLAGAAWAFPHNAGERVGSAAARGTGAAAPFALLPGGALLPRTATTLAAGAGGGAAEQAAREAGLPMPEAFGVAGGLAAGGGAALGLRSTSHAVNPSWAPYAEAGLPPSSAALTTESSLVRRLLNPGVPKDQVQQDIGTAIESVASKFGSSRNWDQLGSLAQSRVRDWVRPDPGLPPPPNSFPGLQAAAWAPVEAGIPASAASPRLALDQTIAAMATKPGPNQAIDQLLGPRTADRALAGMPQNRMVGPGAQSTQLAVPTWEEMRRTRTIIGDSLANPTIAPDLSQAQKEALYAAATEDLRRTAGAYGMGKEFDAANKASNDLFQFRERVLGKITKSDTGGRETISPEDAGKALQASLRKGDESISQLRKFGLPEIADETAGLHLRLTGLDTPANATSPVAKGWPTAWRNLTTTGAHESLINDPEMARHLETLSGLSRRIAEIKPAARVNLTSAINLGAHVAGLGSVLLGGGHGAEEVIKNLLIGEMGGGMVGGAVPWAWQTARDPLAASSRLGGYAASPRAGNLLSRGAATGAGMEAADNPLGLYPPGQQSNQTPQP